MQGERLKILLEGLAEEPNDPFNIYGVAMEYINKENEKAIEYLERLLKEHPNYVPTYYHAASVYADLGKEKEAKATYEKGIEIAHQQHNMKAYDELRRAYRMFLDELE